MATSKMLCPNVRAGVAKEYLGSASLLPSRWVVGAGGELVGFGLQFRVLLVWLQPGGAVVSLVPLTAAGCVREVL